MPKQKYRHEFPQNVRERIRDRDGRCIFCRMGYRADDECGYFPQIMHYIGRAQGGLGVEENGALGCAKHHAMLDNSKHHKEMRSMMADYLKGIYPDWDPAGLKDDKWAFLKGGWD